MRNLGRITSLFLVCFIPQITTSSIFRIWLKKWRFLWVLLLQIRGAYFSLRLKVLVGKSPSLAAQAQAISRVYFTYFSYLRNFSYSDWFSQHNPRVLRAIFSKEKTDPSM